jgi:hypothetical protein
MNLSLLPKASLIFESIGQNLASGPLPGIDPA